MGFTSASIVQYLSALSDRRVTCFCTGSARGRHLMVFGEDRSTNLRRVVVSQRDGLRSDLIHRPGEGTSLREGWCRDLPEKSELSLFQAAAAAAKSNSVPSTSIRCMITASLRANTTFAFFIPTRLASRMAQLLRAEPLTALVRMT